MLLNFEVIFTLILCKFGSVHLQNGRCINSPNSTLNINWPDTQNGQCTYSQPPCVDPNNRQQMERCCENGEWSPHPNCIKVNSVDKCDNIYDSTLNVNWKTTPNDTCVVSEQACVDEENIVQIRCCLNGIFDQPPNCVRAVQPTNNKYCQEEVDAESNVKWFKIPSETCIYGVPSCVDFTNHEQFRCCRDGVYDPEPTCSFKIYKDCEEQIIDKYTWPNTESGKCARSTPNCFMHTGEEICRQCYDGFFEDNPPCEERDCLEIISDGRVWPTTASGEYAKSTPTCFNRNGDEYVRLCYDGSFNEPPTCEERVCLQSTSWSDGRVWPTTESGQCAKSTPACFNHTGTEMCRHCNDGTFETMNCEERDCLESTIWEQVWPTTPSGEYAKSKPTCFNRNGEELFRHCYDGSFEEPPTCEKKDCLKSTSWLDAREWPRTKSGECAKSTPACFNRAGTELCRHCNDGTFASIICEERDCLEITIDEKVWPTTPSGECAKSKPGCFNRAGTELCSYCNDGTFEPQTCEERDCLASSIDILVWPQTESGKCAFSIPACFNHTGDELCRQCYDGTFKEPPVCEERDCLESIIGEQIWPKTASGDCAKSTPACFHHNGTELCRTCVDGTFVEPPHCEKRDCLESTTGEQVWPQTTNGECAKSTPACFNHTGTELCRKCFDGTFVEPPHCEERDCLESATGDQVWPTTPSGECALALPACYNKAGDGLCRQCYDGTFKEPPLCEERDCLESITGDQVWPKTESGECAKSTPACFHHNGTEHCRRCYDGTFDEPPLCEEKDCLESKTGDQVWPTTASGECALSKPACYNRDGEDQCRKCYNGNFVEPPHCVERDCLKSITGVQVWPKTASGKCAFSIPACFNRSGWELCRNCYDGNFEDPPSCEERDCQQNTSGEHVWPRTASGDCARSIPPCYNFGQGEHCRKCNDGSFEEHPICANDDCEEEIQDVFTWPKTKHNDYAKATPPCLDTFYSQYYRLCLNGVFEKQPNCFTGGFCSEEFNHEKQILWPSSKWGECVTSTPLCVNSEKELSKRCCYGLWEEEPECIEIQHEINPCPQGLIFDDKNQLCYLIIEKTKYPPNCPYQGTVSFQEYKHLIESRTVWMPVQKEMFKGNTIGMMRWTEFSLMYKLPFKDYYRSNNYLKENCMVFINHTKMSVKCDDYYVGICAYKILSKKKFNYCNQKLLSSNRCRPIDYNTTTECFCLDTSTKNSNYKAVEFLIPYQNKIMDSVLTSSDVCLIGLAKNYNTYKWIPSSSNLTYTYWSKNANFSTKYNETVYVFLTDRGWLVNQSTSAANCIISQTNLQVSLPELQITHNPQAREINIRVKNFEDLKFFDSKFSIFCFTNAEVDSIIFRYDVVYELLIKPFKVGPGIYWCEGLYFANLKTIIKSNKLLVNLDEWIGNEFVAIIKYKILIETVEFTESTLKLIQNIFRYHWTIQGKYYVRIMEPNFEIDIDDNSVKINLHFTKIGKTVCALKEHFDNFNELYQQLIKITKENEYKNFIFVENLYSTEYCFNDSVLWPTTESNKIAYPTMTCVTTAGNLLTRKCLDDFIGGARWEKIEEKYYCDESSVVTESLSELLSECQNVNDQFEKFNEIVKPNVDKIEPIDVFIISKFLENAANSEGFPPEHLVNLISDLSKVDKNDLFESQNEYNATNSILDSVDKILMKSNVSKENPEILSKSENFLVAIVDLSVKNLSAVILKKNSKKEFEIIPKYSSENLKNNEDFVAMLVIDLKLKQQILNNTKDGIVPQIVIAIYIENTLFNENSTTNKNVGKIFDVLIPGFKGTFVAPIKIIYNNQFKNSEKFCAFWDFNSKNSNGSSWNAESKNNNASNFITCTFWHVTHFALLLLSDEIDDYLGLLDMITNINCILSLFGLSCILMTAILFKKWRSNNGNQMLVHFSLAIALQISLLYISDSIYDKDEIEKVCLIVGALLHYSILSEFCWMLMVAILQFRRFVNVFGGPPKYVVIKSCFFGWVVPLCPVLCVLFLDSNNYLQGNVRLCYPSGLILYLSVWLPITLVLVVNIIIFAYIIFNITHTQSECVVGSNDCYFQWRLAFLLFFMLGLTWIFAFFMMMEFGIIFVYLFSICASLQGFVMFLFFIILNRNTRKMYLRAITNLFKNELN